MKQLMCSHPVIITNPSIYSLISCYGNYYVNNVRNYVNYAERFKCEIGISDLKFSSKFYNLGVEDLDSYYICDEKTGETFPMFIAVPCGKCDLCRNKRSLDWQCRCFLETQTSPSKPLFFTLTYNDDNLHYSEYGQYCNIKSRKLYKQPSLDKKEVQRFMKRLRIRLDRLGYDSKGIRYYICGEYGSKYGRPHYHGLLWNLPYIPLEKWSEFRDTFSLAWKHGFVQLSPSGKGAAKYCMKYMQKGSICPYKFSEKEFFLSSRRNGGLGAEWLRQNEDLFFNHPSIINIEVNDKFTGNIFTFAIPQYFKNKLYPTISRLIPKNIRYGYKLFAYSLRSLCSLSRSFNHGFLCDKTSSIRSFFDTINGWFASFSGFFHGLGFCLSDSLSVPARHVRIDLPNNSSLDKSEKWSNEALHLLSNINNCVPQLLDFINKNPVENLLNKLAFREKHKLYVDRFIDSCPVVDLNYKCEILHKKYIEGLHKEIF